MGKGCEPPLELYDPSKSLGTHRVVRGHQHPETELRQGRRADRQLSSQRCEIRREQTLVSRTALTARGSKDRPGTGPRDAGPRPSRGRGHR